jgi:hypothetical protein
MTAKRLMVASAAVAIVVFAAASGASAFDRHKRGGGGHIGGGGGGRHVTSSGHIGQSGVATGRTVAGHGDAGRYRGYGRYSHGRNRYGVPGTGKWLGLAGWGYPAYAPTSGTCRCGGHFTSGTAGAW